MKGLASWEVVATDAEFWNSMLPEFLAFNLPNVLSSKYRVRSTFVPFTSVPATGCLIWRAGSTLTLTLWFSTFVTVCLRSEKNKASNTTTAPFSFSSSLVLSSNHKFVKHSLIKQFPVETCHVEICTVIMYSVLKHISIQAFEATQSRNVRALTMHCFPIANCNVQISCAVRDETWTNLSIFLM